MLTVFLSGGMSGLTEKEKTGWRNMFKKQLNNMKVISPTDFGDPLWHGDYVVEEKEAFVFDTYWVKKADVIVVNLNKPDSIVTAQEVMLAHSLGKPIIMICNVADEDKIHPWYKEEATTIFYWDKNNPLNTVAEVRAYLIGYYSE